MSAPALSEALSERWEGLIDGMVDRIQTEIDLYRDGPVPRQDLWESCSGNAKFILESLATGKSLDLTSPRETGRRRATQLAPLPAVMTAYRIGSRYLWEEVVSEAAQRQLAPAEALVKAASSVWAVNDAYTQAMTSSYRATVAIEMLRHELRRLGIPSAWRLRPGFQIGIACPSDGAKLDPLVSALREIATGRIGISPPYPALGDTAHGLRLARLALAATRPGIPEVTLFDASPLAVTAVAASDVMARVSRTVLGSLLDLPTDEQAILLETLEAWRDNNGSAADAAAKLYCHSNTVRHRLHRIEERTGRSLCDPRSVAELCLAIEAVRLLPGMSTS
jgi:hypothetical protein